MKKKIHYMDEDHKKKQNKMDDWSKMQSLLRGLYLNLQNDAFDVDYKKKVAKDIEAVEKHKNLLAIKLGRLWVLILIVSMIICSRF